MVKTSVYYLLNARNPTTEKQAEHLRRIERNVELADNVITALSNFAKIPLPESAADRDRADGARGARRSTRRAMGSRSRSNARRSCPTPWATRDQLRIALGNLIRNASDAMPQGGRLTISRLATVDGHVEVSVADTGTGIEAKDLARIMEPLYSTKARGLGLGLAITRSIVEKNQGTLRVTSEPGRGSVFTIRLAAAPGDGAPS